MCVCTSASKQSRGMPSGEGANSGSARFGLTRGRTLEVVAIVNSAGRGCDNVNALQVATSEQDQQYSGAEMGVNQLATGACLFRSITAGPRRLFVLLTIFAFRGRSQDSSDRP